MSGTEFVIPDVLSVRYEYGYGGISPFFEAVARTAPPFRITACEACQTQYCPPRLHCVECWQETTWIDHTGDGRLESLVWAYWIPFDSPARRWTDLPYAYGAVRLDGCRNLIRTRVTGAEPAADASEMLGRAGTLCVSAEPEGRLGDLFFDLADFAPEIVPR